MTDNRSEPNPDRAPEGPGTPQLVTPWMLLGSVFRAWFGVQTEANRARDFSANKASSFILAGIIFVVFLVVAVIVVVNIALSGHTQ